MSHDTATFLKGLVLKLGYAPSVQIIPRECHALHREILSLADSSKHPSIFLETFMSMGTLYRMYELYDQSEVYYRKALIMADTLVKLGLENKTRLINCHFAFVEQYEALGQYKNAFGAFRPVLNLAKKQERKSMIRHTLLGKEEHYC